ncbi:hypothetical protein CIT31_28550 [Mesorhizobium wenxiniae]|uniref:Uncharacterized protein n=1 Tax=Mesorhizobium wenxiniae TaxID=2014805 RepID=A0A271K8Y9_9HYPH|nr:hypothetical protein CIT31_28550 [Mesorhizobium wenxiniae]
MKEFLGFLRQKRAAILKAYDSPLAFCQTLSSAAPQDELATEAAAYLLEFTPDVRDYAVASAYAVLIS